MIPRTGSGWQYALADLSLILFMVTAAALSQAGAKDEMHPSSQGEPLAVWQAAAGSPSLRDWLNIQAPDRRQQLTIIARYRTGGLARAVAEANALAALAGKAGRSARIVVDTREGVFGEAGDAVVAKDAIAGKPVNELAEVVAGKAGGRAHADEITLFKSVGTGIQDIALAAVIYGRATQRGVGTPLPDFPYLKKS